MRRALVLLFVVSVISPALASQPGQPLDCSDWVILEPGISCAVYIPTQSPDACFTVSPSLECALSRAPFGATRVVDAQGNTYAFVRNWAEWPEKAQIIRWNGNSASVVAYIPDRLERDPGCVQCVTSARNNEYTSPYWFGCYETEGTDEARILQFPNLLFDPVNGRLLVGVMNVDSHCPPPSAISGLRQPYVLQFSGFTTMLDILDTFVPSGQSLGYRVPQRPEGLRGTDHFDTYVGEVTRPLDLAQAQPLQCNYPTEPPNAGEYLTFPASATPAPGHALYFLTSVTYQGQTRAGRKAIDGRLSGRDANQLPACVVEKDARR